MNWGQHKEKARSKWTWALNQCGTRLVLGPLSFKSTNSTSNVPLSKWLFHAKHNLKYFPNPLIDPKQPYEREGASLILKWELRQRQRNEHTTLGFGVRPMSGLSDPKAHGNLEISPCPSDTVSPTQLRYLPDWGKIVQKNCCSITSSFKSKMKF